MVASMLFAVNRVGADNTLECVSASSAVINGHSRTARDGRAGRSQPPQPPPTGIAQLLPDARPSPSPRQPQRIAERALKSAEVKCSQTRSTLWEISGGGLQIDAQLTLPFRAHFDDDGLHENLNSRNIQFRDDVA